MNKIREEALSQIPRAQVAQEQGKESKPQSEVIFGSAFRGTPTPISELNLDMASVIIEGEVFQIAHKELTKRNAWVISFCVTD